MEQTEVLARIFAKGTSVAKDLKDIMKVSDAPVKIYGKIGMGFRGNWVVDAWFVGFYEKDDRKIFFSVRLDDAGSIYPDFKKRASLIAKRLQSTSSIKNSFFRT